MTHVHIMPRLRLRGAVPLLPIYAFMAQTGTTYLFTFHVYMLGVCCMFIYDVLSKIFECIYGNGDMPLIIFMKEKAN
jgi:hypothetical protein